MTRLSCELTWMSLHADSDVSNAYTSYENYVSSPSLTTYTALRSSVATAKSTLGTTLDTTTVLGILTHLGASPYSTYLANAQTMASDVTADAASLPTYTVSLHVTRSCCNDYHTIAAQLCRNCHHTFSVGV